MIPNDSQTAVKPHTGQNRGLSGYATQALVTNRRLAANRRDPTRTAMLRRRYEAALKQRFRAVQKAVRKAIVEDDIFNIGEKSPVILQVPPPPRFEFTMSPAQKIQSFLDWLNRAIDTEVLEVTRGANGQILTQSNWQDTYVRSAYNKGLANANAHLSKAGILQQGSPLLATGFNLPIDTDTLSLIYFRQFEQLKGITTAMSTSLSQILTAGLAEGIGPAEIAKRIDKAFKSISIVRSTILARTEIIRTYAEATLNRYEAANVPEVLAEVEFSTAGDQRVCQQCRDLEGKTYTIQDARGVIPVHPQCRCAWLPVVDV